MYDITKVVELLTTNVAFVSDRPVLLDANDKTAGTAGHAAVVRVRLRVKNIDTFANSSKRSAGANATTSAPCRCATDTACGRVAHASLGCKEAPHIAESFPREETCTVVQIAQATETKNKQNNSTIHDSCSAHEVFHKKHKNG
jgi:hypothetical protein